MAPFSLKEIEELYELRELIEPSLVPSTIQHINRDGMKQLKTALEAHLSAEREFYLKERLLKQGISHDPVPFPEKRPRYAFYRTYSICSS